MNNPRQLLAVDPDLWWMVKRLEENKRRHKTIAKIFKINDYDFYMAPSLEEAIKKAISDSGLSREELVDDPHELTDEQIKRLKFASDEFDDNIKYTFSDVRKMMLAKGIKTSFFASELY